MTALIVLNYNDSERTIDLVKRSFNIKEIDKIVVVDNCSTDGSYELLEMELNGKCDLIKSECNKGYAYGNNYGMKYLEKNYDVDIFIISNPDVAFEEELIFKIKKAFTETQYALITGVMKDYLGKASSKAYWRLTTYLDDVFDCSCIGRKIRNKYMVLGIDKEKYIMEVDVVPGSFFAVRADAIRECEYLDEGTFLYYEEDILAARLKQSGYRIGVLTNSYFTHKHILTKQTIMDHKRYLKSKLFYQEKYNQINDLQKVLLKVCNIYSITETLTLIPIKRIINNLKK